VSISTGSPGDEQGYCVVCGQFVRVDPSRPPGDAPCPICGSLLWITPLDSGASLRKGDAVRLRAQGRISPVGAVVAIDETHRRVRIAFVDRRQTVLVDVSKDAVVRSTSGSPLVADEDLPCMNCGAPDQFDPWVELGEQMCVACRKAPASPTQVPVGPPQVGTRVTLLAGPFAGYSGTVAARHCLDGRARVAVEGFSDAQVQIMLAPSEVSWMRGSA
jgi:hypothetical protein